MTKQPRKEKKRKEREKKKKTGLATLSRSAAVVRRHVGALLGPAAAGHGRRRLPRHRLPPPCRSAKAKQKKKERKEKKRKKKEERRKKKKRKMIDDILVAEQSSLGVSAFVRSFVDLFLRPSILHFSHVHSSFTFAVQCPVARWCGRAGRTWRCSSPTGRPLRCPAAAHPRAPARAAWMRRQTSGWPGTSATTLCGRTVGNKKKTRKRTRKNE